MKKSILTSFVSLSLTLGIMLLSACGSNDQDKATSEDSQTKEPVVASGPEKVDDGKGIGEVKNVELTTPLNGDMVTRGQGIYDMKCAACHKLDETKVVGPGWAGVTERRKPEWIMNFITNVDIMLDEDPEAQKMLEECLTRMPNQNISVGDARDLLEFMRKNDGVK